MPAEYKSIKKSSTYELIEKKSRFIADSGIVCNESEARNFINEIKNSYREASHHTYAYVIGKDVPAARYSDDGEPHGTAGLPILDVIQGNGLTDTIVVVTRYFGGTKLGTGGLVRAYSKSASECIALSGITRHIPGVIMDISTDYHNLGKIKNYLEKTKLEIMDEQYTDHVIIRTLVSKDEADSLKIKIKDLTNSTAEILIAGEGYIEAEV
ncbi:MAG: YigZ family protein [Clostridia bacterium]|nr:YigZ family protein [Clostridia bacterium]